MLVNFFPNYAWPFLDKRQSLKSNEINSLQLLASHIFVNLFIKVPLTFSILKNSFKFLPYYGTFNF